MTELTLNDILKLNAFSLKDYEKNEILLKIIKKQLTHAIQNNNYLRNFFERQEVIIENIQNLETVPAIPVQMFKYFDLATCPKSEIVRILKSSGTTSNNPSKIPLNKNTARNQVKALNSILSNYLGKKRKIFLVIDHEGINSPHSEVTARTAGVRGLSNYAKKMFYLLKEEDGKLLLNTHIIEEIIKNFRDYDVYVFGFTFIIWSVFYNQISDKNYNFNFNDIKIFHSGGWKKLKEQKVSKEYFSEKISGLFNTNKENVFDFYGMAEQTGIIFVDCEEGNKHVPNFSQVIIRNLQTLEANPIGEAGLIEVMSILSDSYYSQAILTEDIGYLVGIDNCPCGRKGRHFKFKSRMEKVEVRGCGDTFRESKT